MTRLPTAGVLLVDDVVEFRYLVRILLANVTRCSIVGEAENGLEAVELAERLQPAIVGLDVGMPVMDGLDALPRIRDVAPAAKVIVYSSQPDCRDRALELGSFRYVEKGRDPALVIEAVREAVEATG